MEPKVVHCKMEPYDVYVGRPSRWGNPFSHKYGTMAKYRCDTIEEAIECYREWIVTQPELMNSLHELKGKVLGCWCKTTPNKPCHGDILLELANSLED